MKIYISSCEKFREGENNGRKWVLYKIVDPKGVQYSTFEGKYSGMVGQEIEADVREELVEKNGKTYTNRTIVEPKLGNEQLNRIERKLDELITLLTAETVPDISKDEPTPDLPF